MMLRARRHRCSLSGKMTSPISPRHVKGGIVTLNPDTSVVQRVIALPYNPDSLSRTLPIQAVRGGQDDVPMDILRLRGPRGRDHQARTLATDHGEEVLMAAITPDESK